MAQGRYGTVKRYICHVTIRAVVVIAAIAVAACAFVVPWSDQDGTRYALTQAVANYRTLRIDRWAFELNDKARYDGHWYADKAPGFSFLLLPTYRVLVAANATGRPWTLWFLRLMTGGIAFLAMLALVHVGAEGMAPGTGPLTAAALGAGTFAFCLAPTSFSHLAAGALALAALLLLRRRTDAATAAAGLAVGLAVLFDYLAAFVVVVLAVYVVLTTRSLRRIALFCCGGLPAVAALGVYDQLAFGSPWHLSYRYVVGYYGEFQGRGLFGAVQPSREHLEQILYARRGILVTSPILLVGVAGLVLAAARGSAEAGACLAIVVCLTLYDAGYFDPMGGGSPGPRFLGAALPFAALGLPPLIRGRPFVVAAAVAVSVGLTIWNAVVWTHTPRIDWFFLDVSRPTAALFSAAILAPALVVAAVSTRRAG